MKRTLAILLAVMMVVTLLPISAIAQGLEGLFAPAEIDDSWTLISSAEDFAAINNVVGKFILTKDIDISSLTAPVSLLAQGAILNGNGHKITGANFENTSGLPYGVIARNKGTIQNLTVYAPKIKGGALVGGLVGLNEGTITNCHVTGGSVEAAARVTSTSAPPFTATTQDGESQVGGLVGENKGTIEYSTTTHTVVTAHVYEANKVSLNYGGLVGLNLSGTISKCVADTPEILLDQYSYIFSSGQTYYRNVGGLVGYNKNGYISDSMVQFGTGSVILGYKTVGGIIGYNDCSNNTYVNQIIITSYDGLIDSSGNLTNDNENAIFAAKGTDLGGVYGYDYNSYIALGTQALTLVNPVMSDSLISALNTRGYTSSNWHLVVGEKIKPATYAYEQIPFGSEATTGQIVIDEDGSDGYEGDYVLIYNPSTTQSSKASTGNMTGLISTTSSSIMTQYDEDLDRWVDKLIDVSDRKLGTKGIQPQATSYSVGDTATFKGGEDLNTSIQFKVAAVGTHCYVWVPVSYQTAYNPTTANINTLISNFDSKYETMTAQYGMPSYTGKINLLVYRINTSWNGSGSYTAGYFANSRNDTLHIDTYPTIERKGIQQACSTMMHEFQHLIYYTRTGNMKPTWFNEMMSMTAEELVYPGSATPSRIQHFMSYGELFHEGRSMYNWDSDVGSYGISCLFGQYLRVHTGSYEVFDKLINYMANHSTISTEYSYVNNALQSALQGTELEGKSLSELVVLARIAMNTASTGIDGGLYSYKGEEDFKTLNPMIFTGSSATIEGGGAITVVPVGGVYYPPSGASSTLRYVGIKITEGDEPISGGETYQVTFNAGSGTFYTIQGTGDNAEAVPATTINYDVKEGRRLPSIPTPWAPQGYKFDKWTINGNEVTNLETYEVSGAVTITANFVKVDNSTNYYITRQDQLEEVALHSDTGDEVFVILNDLALTGGFNPNKAFAFMSTLDGNNKTITGLYIDDETQYSGMICQNYGTIKNLTIVSPKVNSGDSSGVVCGENYGKITNVKVTNPSLDGDSFVGGIAGINGDVTIDGYGRFTGVIENCSVTGGYVYGGLTQEYDDDPNSTGNNVGGLVGANYEGATITKCEVNNVKLHGTKFVGGFVGLNVGTIEYSSAKETSVNLDLVANGSTFYQEMFLDTYTIFEVMGYNFMSCFVAENGETGVITNSYVYAPNGGVFGSENIAGLVAVNGGSVENCYAYIGKITKTSVSGVYTDGTSDFDVSYNTQFASPAISTNHNGSYSKDGTATNVYFRAISGYTTNANNCKALTAAQSIVATNYAGFDFRSVWNTSSSINGGMPYIDIRVAQPQVTFDYNNGTGTTKVVTVTSGSTVPSSEIPTPTNGTETFVGWFKADGTAFDFATPITNDIILVAHWTHYYQVTFVDGITGDTLKTEQVEVGKDATAPVPPTHDGYTFKQWDREFTNVQSDLTVTAVYESNAVMVTATIVDGEGQVQGTIEVEQGNKFSQEQRNSITNMVTLLVNNLSDSVNHYRFDKFTVNNVEIDLENYELNSNVVITIELEQFWYVRFFCDNGKNPLYNPYKQCEVVDGEAVSEPTDIDTTATTGKVFTGWYAGEVPYYFNAPVHSDLNIEAKFDDEKFTVTFYGAKTVNEETGTFNYEVITVKEVAYNASVTAPSIGEFVPSGYEFANWGNQSLTSVTSNMFVYAQYNKLIEEGKVLFYAKFTDGKQADEYLGYKNVVVGETLAKSGYAATKSYTGYHFFNWSVENVQVTDKNGSYIVYALYERNEYTVTFTGEDGTVIATQARKHGEKLDIAQVPADPTKQDAKFDGWYNGNSKLDVYAFVVTGNVTFTAKFTAKDSVNFLLYDNYIGEAVNGGSIGLRVIPRESEITIPADSQMQHEGYTFLGWFDKDGNPFDFDSPIRDGYNVAFAEYEVIKAAPLTAPSQTITASGSLNDAIAQANAVAGTNRVEISLTTDATITGMVDLTRANVTINGNGHKVTGASTTSASGGLRIKADGLMLKDITWDTSSNKAWAMRVLGNFNVYFDGTVNVKSASGYAGIHVTQDLSNNDVTATFIGVSNDAVLNITGGQSAAAIGSTNAQNSKSGIIVMRAGTFNLTGGLNAAAIGGSARGSANDVIIRGNYVVEGSTEPIKLVVNAVGGKYGAAIGTGYLYTEKNKMYGDLIIADGAVVNATSGQTAAAFGSGKRTYDPKGGMARISGETTQVNFFGSTVSGFKDGTVDFRGGSFFDSVALNQGMTISGNQRKVLKVNASASTPKAQNILLYTNSFMDYVPTDMLGDVIIALCDAKGNEYTATNTMIPKLAGKAVARTTSSNMNFLMEAGDNAIARVITISDELVQAGYYLSSVKNTVKFVKD